jgi:hypothetical protein
MGKKVRILPYTTEGVVKNVDAIQGQMTLTKKDGKDVVIRLSKIDMCEEI